ncbi:MAG: ribokinase [Verrucomicrobiota bacterium]
MKFVNLGSLNIDHVYEVDHFLRPGETMACTGYRRFCGGKGLNQSIALARAGACVHHAGRIGHDGAGLRDRLEEAGVHTGGIRSDSGPTGHAIIQVTPDGNNAIMVEAGANHRIDETQRARTLDELEAGDWLLLQNEINDISSVLEAARGRNIRVAYNPAPMNRSIALDGIHTLILNEIEGEQLTGRTEPDDILDDILNAYPTLEVVLTLGEHGAIHTTARTRIDQPAEPIDAVDTTAAGDTFIGYFLHAITSGQSPEQALRLANRASAICITRPGAADSIPAKDDVEPTGDEG